MRELFRIFAWSGWHFTSNAVAFYAELIICIAYCGARKIECVKNYGWIVIYIELANWYCVTWIAHLFLLLLSCLVVSSSSDSVVWVGVNCVTSDGVRFTSWITVSTFDRAVLWRVVIGLICLIHPMDASRRVSNLSHLIQAQESLRVAMIFPFLCLNWFSFKADSMLWWEKICLDLNLSNSSVVLENFFVVLSTGKSSVMFLDFTDLCDEFEGWFQDLYRSDKLAMGGGDVDCIVSWF